VNYSHWDSTLEPVSPGVFAVRLGPRRTELRQGGVPDRGRPDATLTDLVDIKDRARFGGGDPQLAVWMRFGSMT
jgi:error-prone DNA polymerase